MAIMQPHLWYLHVRGLVFILFNLSAAKPSFIERGCSCDSDFVLLTKAQTARYYS